MNDCRQIEPLLPPYVDGAATPEEVSRVEAHAAECRSCRQQLHAERTVRTVLRARAEALATTAPPGLRTRLLALAAETAPRGRGWRGRLSAFAAAAAALILVVGVLEFVSPQSSTVLAAQLALDHVRCFLVEHFADGPVDAGAAERAYAEHYGWTIAVPPSNAAADLTLVAARRCPFWLGPYAHLMYRTADDREVSLYVTEGERPSEVLRAWGHVERLWTANGRTYALVARGLEEARLQQVTAYLQGAAGAR